MKLIKSESILLELDWRHAPMMGQPIYGEWIISVKQEIPFLGFLLQMLAYL